MLKFKSEQVYIGIITGIIASIFFVYFLDPILSFIGAISLKILGFIYKNTIDGIYQEIATGRTDFDYYLFLLASSFIIAIAIFAPLHFKDRIWQKEISHSQNVHSEIEKLELRLKILYFVMLSSSVVVVILWVYNLSVSYLKLKTISEFDQEIKILSPYIGENQEKRLISKFSSMQSLEDYRQLKKDILKIAIKSQAPIPDKVIHRIEVDSK